MADMRASAIEGLIPAVVTAITAGGITVRDEQGREFEADLLYTSDAMPLTLAEGDTVLALVDPERGAMILGRIGGTVSPHARSREAVPEELVLEARENLTLKCGEGSITIRADGKVLIKGRNLVSLALETNRIKGGSVSIN